MRGLFVTGTDTGVGKTFVASAIVRYFLSKGFRVGAYKPVASGAVPSLAGELVFQDVEELWRASGEQFPRERICPQTFAAIAAPPVAARAENQKVNETLFQSGFDWWKSQVDILIVEGAGGWRSPLSDHLDNGGFAVATGLPVVVVGRIGLGTINHTLLTVEAVERQGCPLAGVLLNQTEPGEERLVERTNPQVLNKRLPRPLLGVFPWLSVQEDLLNHDSFRKINWENLLFVPP